MTKNDIATLPIEPHMSLEQRILRKKAPLLVKKILENTFEYSGIKSLTELTKDSIIALEGGVSSAVYFLKHTENPLVIKLRHSGVGAEAEAILAWQAKRARVVDIKKVGLVEDVGKVKYLIQEGVLKKDQLAKTCFSYLQTNPKKAELVGKLMGEELAKMHTAKSNRTYGEFADMAGKKAPFKTWNSYILGYINVNEEFLIKEVGLGKEKIQLIKLCINKVKYPQKGVYLHGDYSLRNILVESEKPFQIRIFDPNPIIGHPSWDIANIFNNARIATERLSLKPKTTEVKRTHQVYQDLLKGFINGYEKANGRIDRRKIYPSAFVQSILRLTAEVRRAKQRTKQVWNDPDVVSCKATLEYLADQVIITTYPLLLSKR